MVRYIKSMPKQFPFISIGPMSFTALSKNRRLIVSLSTLPLVLVSAAFFTEYKPQSIEHPILTKSFDSKDLQIGVPFTVLNWNLQYAGSRKHHFFYDGGEVVGIPKEDVLESLEGIKESIKRYDPDILLFQEIDRDSQRTHRIDQLREILFGMSGWSWTSVPYHRSSFVPAPFKNPLGRVDLHEAVLSRFALDSARRVQLALLQEPRWRQMFNLKRALLSTNIPIKNKNRQLHVATVHLSAFSFGDGTLDKQIDQLVAWIQGIPPNHAWILAGDFNLLPPNDNPNRLEDGEKYYDAVKNPILKLTSKYNYVFQGKAPDDESTFTYQPFGQKPDRKIDFMFYGGSIAVVDAEVISSDISDHLPIFAKFVLKE